MDIHASNALAALYPMPRYVEYPKPQRVPGSAGSKTVFRHVLDATLEQHRACLILRRKATQRCISRGTSQQKVQSYLLLEAKQQRVIDLLVDSGCNTLREWQERFGPGAV